MITTVIIIFIYCVVKKSVLGFSCSELRFCLCSQVETVQVKRTVRQSIVRDKRATNPPSKDSSLRVNTQLIHAFSGVLG